MTFKKILSICIVFCLMAASSVAMSGCDDLGAYENTEEYYGAFGDIVMIGAASGVEEYSVEEYFYNENSREDFLTGDEGAYEGVPYGDYVYVAIPFERNIDVDSLALYIRSQHDATVYINVFVTDKIPSKWRPLEGGSVSNIDQAGGTDQGSGNSPGDTEEEYDDPAPETRIGELVVQLKEEKWGSFVLDAFMVNGLTQKSIQIEEGQIVLLQIRNNSGIRIFDPEKQAFVDPQTGRELSSADITMTNLLIRALKITAGNESQGGN